MFELITNHFFGFLSATFFWWAFGVILGIVGIVFLNKKGLLKRDKGLLKAMVFSYYIGIPFVLGFSFGTYGLIRNIEQEMVDASSSTLNVIKEVTYPAFNKHIAESLKDLNQNISKEDFVNGFVKNGSGNLSRIQNEITSSVLDYVIDFAAKKVLTGTSQVLGVDDGTLVDVLSAISNGGLEVFHEELFSSLDEFIITTIGRIFSPYYIFNVVLFFLLIAIPAIELIGSGLRLKRK